MDSYLREFFIYRISSRFLIFDELRIYYPTVDILYEAQNLYVESYKKAVEDKVMSDEDVVEQLYSRGLWTLEDEEQLTNVLPKHIEYWKVELFNNFDNHDEAAKIMVHLVTAKEALEELFKKRHQLDYLTCHGVATFAKYYYVMEHSVFKGKKKYKWNTTKVFQALNHANQNAITEEAIRDIARTEPWQTLWNSSAKSNGVFMGSAAEFTEDQKRLINWSKVYENVKEYEDCPKIAIIECDDAFDGWLILKKRESDGKKNEKSFENKVSRHSENAEVFIPVDRDWSKPKTLDEKLTEANKIYSLNNQINRGIIKNRIAKVQEKGEAVDMDFTDVKVSVGMARTRAEIAKKKNG